MKGQVMGIMSADIVILQNLYTGRKLEGMQSGLG